MSMASAGVRIVWRVSIYNLRYWYIVCVCVWFKMCFVADPVVHAGLELLEDDVHFVHVNVGERLAWVPISPMRFHNIFSSSWASGPSDRWREPNSPFRTEPRLKLVWVPTLLNWRTSERVDSRHVSDAVQVNALLQRRAPDSDTAWIIALLSQDRIYKCIQNNKFTKTKYYWSTNSHISSVAYTYIFYPSQILCYIYRTYVVLSVIFVSKYLLVQIKCDLNKYMYVNIYISKGFK